MRVRLVKSSLFLRHRHWPSQILIARVTLEDLHGVYFDAGQQMLDAFEYNRARIGAAAARVISANRMATDGGATILTELDFSEPY
jgi:hypothetical protein